MNKMMNKVELRILLAIFMFLPAIAGLAQSATITVGSGAGYNFNTIQAGIDAAVDGGTVLVAPGEYVITEPITFRGKAITVKSESGSDETTIRMGTPTDNNRGSVVVFENGETDTSVLEGFTITGGRGFWFPSVNAFGAGGVLFIASSGIVRDCAIIQNNAEYGGGIGCASTCSPKLMDCTIAENLAEENGGGVLIWTGPSLTMANCTIRENSTTRYGGGLHCWQDSSLTMTDCVISKNSVTGDTPHVAGYGGGLCCMDNSTLSLTNCNIVENSTGIGGGGIHCWNGCLLELNSCAVVENSVTIVGGGMFCEEHSSVTMNNCIVSGNSATGRHQAYPGLGVGGGIDFWGNTSLTLSNCTITGNSAADNAGGMVCDFGCSGAVTNSIVWGNTAPIAPDIRLIFGSTLEITYSDVAGGKEEIILEGESILNWGAGNIDADPLFADPNNGDYHLKSEAGRWDPNSQSWVVDDVTSPCIDAGDPNSDWTGEIWPHGERINMGAYGGTREASMSTRPEAMSLPTVAYIYLDDEESADSFRSFLMRYGCLTTLIELGQVATESLDSYDLIIVGNDTGRLRNWGDNQSVSAIETPGKPVVGLGEGGYAFFGKLDLLIGWGHGWHGNDNSIYVMKPNYPLFSTPYVVDIPDDRILRLYTQTGHVGIHLNPRPDTVVTIGRETGSPTHYPVVLENQYLLWGFTESPLNMTEEGKRLFINVVIRASNNALGS